MIGRRLFSTDRTEGWWVKHSEGGFYIEVAKSRNMFWSLHRMEGPPSSPHLIYGVTVDQEVPKNFLEAINEAVKLELLREQRTR